jgi:hypothetical protein
MKDEAEMSAPMLGSVGEPVAYMLRCMNREVRLFETRREVYAFREYLSPIEKESMLFIPLYRKPTLTAGEREAIQAAAQIIDAYDEEMDGFPSGAAKVLRGLLARCATGHQ